MVWAVLIGGEVASTAAVEVIKDYIEKNISNIDFDEYTLPESVIDAFVEKVVVHKDKYEWHLTLWDDDKVIYSNSEGKVNNNTVNVWEESSSCDGSTNHIRLTKVNLQSTFIEILRNSLLFADYGI